ncbi:hypothetical protein F5H01DRAFT_315851 [Linnemannia elongata]|nr:hypothetical protein F5H01DRAFT_315851 [Linnemannia elongata]
MGAILLACPLLKQVHVSSLSVGAVEVNWSWIPFGHVDGNNNKKDKDRNYSSKDRGKGDESSQQRHPSSLPLRSVILENTSVELSGLESLLSFTPDLQELKLIQLSAPRTNQQLSSEGASSSTVTNIATFFPRLKDILKRHGITLNSFHFSLDNEPLLPTLEAAARLNEILKEICHPLANKWSFWTSADLPLFAYQSLVQIPNVVTTLELHSSKIGRCPMTGCKLHQYLCESPHLLHLKAPRTAFLVDHFDIHGLVNATIAAYEAGTETERASLRYLSCTACGAKTGLVRPTIIPDSGEVDYDDEQDVRRALVNLGFVQDIVDVMDELDVLVGEREREVEGGVARCWPHLQKIALYRPNRYGLTRREEAIQHMVSDTFFRTLVRKTFY